MKMKDHRNIYPFRIGTTSYILPIEEDNLVANVEFLKNSFDKIQLLYFSKDYLHDVMSAPILKRLEEIRGRSGVEYSVHLPVDLGLLAANEDMKKRSIDIIETIIQSTAKLGVREYILHIDRSNGVPLSGDFAAGGTAGLFTHALEMLNKKCGCLDMFYIENTSYDLTEYADVIERYDMPVCMDIGHLLLCGLEIDGFIQVFNKRIKEVHLHGFSDGEDHRSLAETDRKILRNIWDYLKTYTASVIIEVFNEEDLAGSMGCLYKLFREKSWNIQK
ncbi:cobamide remodeling phosphodiesterase CbiR [Spirochaetota bacterium]